MSESLSPQRQSFTEQGFEQIQSELQQLMRIFGSILRRLGEEKLAEVLPWTEVQGESIIETSSAQTELEPAAVAQTYSIAFQLLNMIEERVSVQVRRMRVRELGSASIRGSWAQEIAEMRNAGVSEEELAQLIGRVQIEPVLTAHPTEAKRTAVRERHRDIYETLRKSENAQLTNAERTRLATRLEVLLETLWRTGEVHLERPEVGTELRVALFYLRDVFPRVLHEVRDSLRAAWQEAGWHGEPAFPRLRCGTWIGGDRDGHPGVTAQVTKDTLATLRGEALSLFVERLEELGSELSLTQSRQALPTALQTRIEELRAKVGVGATEPLEGSCAPAAKRSNEEPWKEFCALCIASLEATSQQRPCGYDSVADFDADLILLEESLAEVGAENLAHEMVFPLRHQLRATGFHLARLDVRQNSAFHDRAMEIILEHAGIEDGQNFGSWSEEKRRAFCEQELTQGRPFLPPGTRPGEQADAVLDCLSLLSKEHRNQRSAGLGSLIVSMTRSVSDLLVLTLLCREAGLVVAAPKDSGLPFLLPQAVVPLFETLEDLAGAPAIMEVFLDNPIIAASTKLWAQREDFPSGGPERLSQVMLGYSDSNKDCGLIASAHALYRAQSELTAVAAARGVELAFFHGRGGTISRGAGPTHWFLSSLPAGSIGSIFRMTEQGETIAQKYAHGPSASYHLETLLASVTSAVATGNKQQKPVISDSGLELLGELAQRSKDTYQALLKREDFITFYRSATPIDALENSRIGSRPSRRTGKKKPSLDDLRAIPWVFSWTQARFYLPGWYGAGTALESFAQDETRWRQLSDLVKESVLIRYILTNIETNLSSSNPELMKLYATLVPDANLREAFMSDIFAERDRAVARIEELFGGQSFANRRPRLFRTLQIRETPLNVLHHQQIDLLRKWRELKESDEAAAETFFPNLLATINAIASGLRTTG